MSDEVISQKVAIAAMNCCLYMGMAVSDFDEDECRQFVAIMVKKTIKFQQDLEVGE